MLLQLSPEVPLDTFGDHGPTKVNWKVAIKCLCADVRVSQLLLMTAFVTVCVSVCHLTPLVRVCIWQIV